MPTAAALATPAPDADALALTSMLEPLLTISTLRIGPPGPGECRVDIDTRRERKRGVHRAATGKRVRHSGDVAGVMHDCRHYGLARLRPRRANPCEIQLYAARNRAGENSRDAGRFRMRARNNRAGCLRPRGPRPARCRR